MLTTLSPTTTTITTTTTTTGAESPEDALINQKKTIDNLTLQLSSSKNRERRLLERCRVLKEYGENSKSKIGMFSCNVGWCGVV